MSFNVAMLEAMQAEGLDLAACIRILRSAGPDTAAEKRRAYDRERKREKREAERVSGGMSGGNPPDPSPNERDNLTPTREKPKPSGLVKGPDRGFRLPSNWEPEALSGRAAEMVACWKAGELERELAKFKNYWMSKGANAARTNWQRTWVNWLISADERKPRNERSNNPLLEAVSRIVG